MRRTRPEIALSCLLLAALACAGEPRAAETAAAPDATLIETRDRYVQAAANEDFEGLTGFWAEDAVLMPPGHPVVERDGLAAFFDAIFLHYDVALEIASRETQVAGDWGFDRGGYTMSYTPRTAPEGAAGAAGAGVQSAAPVERGKYLILFRRQADGAWKVSRHIWSADGPPAP